MYEAHFQTFEEPESGVALTARLSAFREELARRKLTGFVIPRADQQQNEYVAPSEERLAWLTGSWLSAQIPRRGSASRSAAPITGTCSATNAGFPRDHRCLPPSRSCAPSQTPAR